MVNTVAADALAHRIASTLASTVSNIQDSKFFVFHDEGFQQPAKFPQNHSALEVLTHFQLVPQYCTTDLRCTLHKQSAKLQFKPAPIFDNRAIQMKYFRLNNNFSKTSDRKSRAAKLV